MVVLPVAIDVIDFFFGPPIVRHGKNDTVPIKFLVEDAANLVPRSVDAGEGLSPSISTVPSATGLH